MLPSIQLDVVNRVSKRCGLVGQVILFIRQIAAKISFRERNVIAARAY
jgi:hypothetical protein